jgi:hypothetical protein
VSLAEDRHAAGEFGSDCQHEALGEAVRSRATGRDLGHLDTCIRQHRVERRGELTGPIPDREPESVGALAEIHHQVAGLLSGPRSVGMAGHAQDVQILVVDLEDDRPKSCTYTILGSGPHRNLLSRPNAIDQALMCL